MFKRQGEKIYIVVYEFAMKFKNLFFDNLSGVKINAKTKPINIAVTETATVIKVA